MMGRLPHVWITVIYPNVNYVHVCVCVCVLSDFAFDVASFCVTSSQRITYHIHTHVIHTHFWRITHRAYVYYTRFFYINIYIYIIYCNYTCKIKISLAPCISIISVSSVSMSMSMRSDIRPSEIMVVCVMCVNKHIYDIIKYDYD